MLGPYAYACRRDYVAYLWPGPSGHRIQMGGRKRRDALQRSTTSRGKANRVGRSADILGTASSRPGGGARIAGEPGIALQNLRIISSRDRRGIFQRYLDNREVEAGPAVAARGQGSHRARWQTDDGLAGGRRRIHFDVSRAGYAHYFGSGRRLARQTGLPDAGHHISRAASFHALTTITYQAFAATPPVSAVEVVAPISLGAVRLL